MRRRVASIFAARLDMQCDSRRILIRKRLSGPPGAKKIYLSLRWARGPSFLRSKAYNSVSVAKPAETPDANGPRRLQGAAGMAGGEKPQTINPPAGSAPAAQENSQDLNAKSAERGPAAPSPMQPGAAAQSAFLPSAAMPSAVMKSAVMPSAAAALPIQPGAAPSAGALQPAAPQAGAIQAPALPPPARILEKITSPADVRALTIEQLRQLADETRARIIDVVARKGGHFAAPLGAVELAVALLKVLDVPEDRVIWDVGHQSYAWKILTGRNTQFETIRHYKGISGFLKRSESECDAFGAGHASTSLAAALGMALARDRQHRKNHVAAVIGDGSMTGGMAYEALNNIGLNKVRCLIVFNDNEMSISPNVWSIHRAFNQMITSALYNEARKDLSSVVRRYRLGDRLLHLAHRVEESVKGLLVPGLFFEELGIRYFGPVDGHNLDELIPMLQKVRDMPGPIVLHVITKKGKGYSFSEADPVAYHGATKIEVSTGIMPKSSGPPSYMKVFGDTLTELAAADKRIVAITAAMGSGTGLDIFQKTHPERFYDVGIAEECAVTMAGGMACEGIKPVVAIYSTFLQRAFDNIIHDVALQHLPVVFALDRAGLVGADGPTHHGTFDLSYLRMIPGLVLMAPKDEQELRQMLRTAVEYEKGPIALRYPRGNGLGRDLSEPYPALEIGRAEVTRRSEGVALLAIGTMWSHADKAADILEREHQLRVTVVNARFVKPLDEELLKELAKTHRHFFTIEDNTIQGGFGSAVNEAFQALGIPIQAQPFGLPDRFVDHGSCEELYRELGLMPDQVAARILEKLQPAT